MAEEIEGWGATDAPNDGYASDTELDTRKLKRMAADNRKNKKSGGFQSMGLSSSVLRGVLKKGYKFPTPIQRKTIPIILEGKDVVAMARTGSGKTASFLIPLFEKLQSHSPKAGARALILSPTRELAMQTLKFTKELGMYLGLRAAVVLGGDSMEGQFAALHDNPDIIIATPGRLVHVCVEMSLKFQYVEYVVFDEADRLYEMGFAEQLSDIIRRLPDDRQTLLFSATLPKMLVEFARAGLSDPVLIRLDTEKVLSENLKMAFFKVNSEEKLALLLYLLHQVINPYDQTVIFAATKHHVDYLHMALDLAGFPNTFCYSSLDATARKINVAKFRNRRVNCLLVTDIAARGIDIPLLDNVINFNFPAKPKLFVHRVGRVARAGRSGVAYSFVAHDEAAYLLDLHLFLSKDVRFAPQTSVNNQIDDWDYMYGSVPQTVIDAENEQIATMHKTSTDLAGMKKVISNAYKQYVKSRPVPSNESMKRMKESEWICNIGYHPLLISKTENLEGQYLNMLNTLKNLHPRTTVFDMSKSKKFYKMQSSQNMKAKRDHDEKRIETFHKAITMKQISMAEKEAKKKEAAESVKQMEPTTEEDVEDTFATIVGKKKRKTENLVADRADKGRVKTKAEIIEILNKKKKKARTGEDLDSQGSQKNKENVDFKDKEFYIPYNRNNQYADQGYSLGTSFVKEVDEAAMDIVMDDDPAQRRVVGQLKWDKKKKNFVGAQNHKRKIRTESGALISASYKTGIYDKWIKKGRHLTSEKSDDEENETPGSHMNGKSGVKTINRENCGKTHPLLSGRKLKNPRRRELKTDDEITKEKNRKDSERKKHKEALIRKKAKLANKVKRRKQQQKRAAAKQ